MTRNDIVTLNLKFKGQRNYIQGGDIFNAINDLASQITDHKGAFVSNLAFRRFAKNDCDLYLDHPGDNKSYVARGNIADSQGGVRQRFFVFESDRVPAGRYDFDEDAIVKHALLEGQKVILQGRTAYTPIEEAIALTKAFHYKVFPAPAGKWVFGQLDLVRPFSLTRRSLWIGLEAAKAQRFTVSKIFEDDEFAGDIRFIVGEP